MNELNKKKVVTAVVACALVLAAVSFAERVPSISQFLKISSQVSAVAHSTAVAAQTREERGAAATTSAPKKVNINTAGTEELDTLSGIGPSKAEAIVAYRNASGPFYRIEDIMNVRGIGKAMFGVIAKDITVGIISPPAEIPVSTTATPAPEKAFSSDASSQRATSSARILVTAVLAGIVGNAGYEYIELYNPSAQSVDLTGWSVKKRSSTGSVSTLIASSHFSGKIIPPEKHFLLARDGGYTGTVAPDIVWPASYSFSHTNTALVLYDYAGHAVEMVSWSEIPEGKSYSRISPGGDDFTITDPSPRGSSL